MPLRTECPRCGRPLEASVDDPTGAGWACAEHGPTAALRRPEEASYDAFIEVLAAPGDFPTYLPWPMSPGWVVSDFAVAGERESLATLTCSSGTSALDGPVDVFVVSEESGT